MKRIVSILAVILSVVVGHSETPAINHEESENNNETLQMLEFIVTNPTDQPLPTPEYHDIRLFMMNQDLPTFRLDRREWMTGTPGVIASWSGGDLRGIMSGEHLMGLGAIESGGFAVQQYFGRFSAEIYGEAVKYGTFSGIQRSMGVGGSLSYRFSDKLSMTLFGNYYSNPGPMLPAMAGYARATSFGGYFDYSISDRWGVQVGAQGVQSLMYGKVEARPIVKPYFKISNKAAIGVDVGGILYEAIRDGRGYNKGNPTIQPPKMQYP